jgi:integrase
MDGYPYVSELTDRHGTVRYRFRRKKVDVYLPGAPGDAIFEEHYRAAIEGRPPRTAEILLHPGGVVPQSFAAAWRLVQKSAEWKRLDAATRLKNERLTEAFLKLPVVEDAEPLWRDQKVADLRRRHVRHILSVYSDTPHKAKHMLTALRRMLNEALDQDWIEYDPSAKMNWRPEYTGWRAWTLEERGKFEARWPNGTMPRAAYALALWAGCRRGDVAAQAWDDIDFAGERITVRQKKHVAGRRSGDKDLRLLMLPMLRAALDPLPRRAETVITTEYGKSFSEKSLTGMMAHWTKLAGMGDRSGCTFHGLRKTLGKYLAEEGATAKQAAGILGHDDLDHVELYSREAEQERLAVDGLSRLVKRFG